MDKYRGRPRSQKHVTLPPEDEEMVRNLRSAGRKARRKIEDLEDEVTTRDRAYASESAFRRPMEERAPTRVVDMYNNEDVTSELQARLPRGRGTDRFAYRPASLSPERLAAPSERSGLLLSPAVTGAPLVLSPVSLPFGDSGAARRVADRDESRQISTLLRELEAVKDDNRRLQQQLSEARLEADQANAAALTSKAEVDALVAAQVADAIQEIRSAQKSRDQAMMARLRAANEERDVAIQRTQLFEDSPAETEKPIDAQFSRNNYQKSSGRDEDNSLATLRAERDEAVQKYHQLLQEFNSHQKKGALSENADFGQVIAERDDALRKLRTMEDEMQTLRVYYSLHKSLSPERIANQLGTKSLEQLRSDLQAALGREAALAAEVERMTDATDAALSDRDRAEAELAKSKRLVNVLRRKLNGPDTQ